MVQSLGWDSLQHRRYIDRLSMPFRVQHGLVDVTTDYIQLNDTCTRGSQRLHQLNATKDVYKYSFYSRTICDWNQLPPTVQTLQEFRGGLSSLPSQLLRPYYATQQHVHSFNRGSGTFYLFIGHRSFILSLSFFLYILPGARFRALSAGVHCTLRNAG